ncbi:MAG TPA: PEGA domain-containing protein [Vicinamibacteria bacterium]|nr:PEGA domain-containing protein [Vicinamibacteria bacterium]
MTVRHVALALAMGGLASPLWAQHHGGGGGSSGGGGGHSYSGGGHSSSGTHYAGTASPRSSSGSGTTLAESRHPRAGTGTAGFYGGRYYGGRYYRPYYSPFYGSLYFGWPYYYDPFFYGGYYGGGYYGGYYGAPGYYGYRYGDRASLRVMVNPDKTRVFVDGAYAGVADDFDGLFQRLHVSSGRHLITLKLEGYRTHSMKVYVAGGSTLKIKYDMVKGSGDDPVEDLAGDAGLDAEHYDDRARPGERSGERDRDVSRDRDVPQDERSDRDHMRAEVRDSGRLRLEVLPADASVYVDGQFRGTARQVGELELPPGRHRVEIVRPGFRTDDRDVDVEPGRTRDLRIELQRP